MSRSVLVVGGGVVGLCAAWYARKAGHRVTVLERGGLDHDSCSLGNAGMIVPSHFIPLAAPGMIGLGMRMLLDPGGPFAIRPRPSRELADWGLKFWRAANAGHVARSAPVLRDLNLASRAAFEELAGDLGDSFGLARKGLIMLCRTDHALREETEVAGRARELGLPAEVLDPAQAARLEPGIEMDIAGAVYFPKDCHLVPRRFVAALTTALAREGVAFVWGAEVTGWRAGASGGIEAVRTEAGEYWADEYVLACGAWTPRVACGLDLYLPMLAGKGYSLTLERPRQTPEICAILTEARIAVTPMDGALRFAGTMELTGLDPSINQARVRGIRRSIPRYFPAYQESDFDGLPVWSGLRPCSPDGLPYVGRSARYANLVVAAGHAMMGLSLAPVTGKLVAEIVSGVPTSLEITALRPDRYRRGAPVPKR